MSEYRDLSRLPADQKYWDDLEARVLAGITNDAPVLPAAWWSPLAARAALLGGMATAAAVAALFLMPARATQVAVTGGLLRLPEDDPTVAAFVSASTPPSLTSLMLPDQGSR